MLVRMTTLVHVELNFDVSKDEDKRLTALCREFPGLVTCADSSDEMEVMIESAVTTWFKALEIRGTLVSELQRIGVTAARPTAGITFDTHFNMLGPKGTFQPGIAS